MYDALSEIEGLEVYRSHANFILFRINNVSSGEIFESLQTHGVLIKNLGNNDGPLKNCLRVTLGTEEKNQKFLVTIKQVLADNS